MDDDFGKRIFLLELTKTTNLSSPRSDNYQKIKKKTCVPFLFIVCARVFLSRSLRLFVTSARFPKANTWIKKKETATLNVLNEE